MRKLLLLFVVSAMTLGCSKDNDVYSGTDELIYQDADKIALIVWESKSEDRSSLLGFEKVETETIHIMFNPNGDFTTHFYLEDNISSGYIQEKHLKGKFTYNYPNIVLNAENGLTEKLKINKEKNQLSDEYGHTYRKL